MIKKLSKYGNSFAIVIEKPILKLLNINENTEVKIKTDGNSIIIEPIRKEKQKSIKINKKLQEIYENITKEYAEALKKLAE